VSVAVFLEASRRYIATGRHARTDDPNSACNRAYYAIREAARAALLVVGEAEAANAKTHAGLRTQFNLHLIKSGKLPQVMDENFAFAAQQRMVADYDGVLLAPSDADAALDRAEQFLKTVIEFVERPQ
jgi:uncharacterized protein (UPF0332 family)